MARQTTIRGPLKELVDELGGVVRAAKFFGVDRRTIRRWGTGETTPSKADRQRINREARAWGIAKPF